MKKLILISLGIIFVNGCTQRVPVSSEIILPPALVLPEVSGSMECLAPETYQALVTRDKLQTERRTTLRKIIEAANE